MDSQKPWKIAKQVDAHALQADFMERHGVDAEQLQKAGEDIKREREAEAEDHIR